jgi:4a-hydroxytetrahydrobiopterin dehydratase
MAALVYRKLDESEIVEALSTLDGWERKGDEIERTIEFKTYKDGVVFAVAVAHLADALDHHPDLLVGYQKVTIRVSTHSVGGLSPYDFELTRRIESLL